MSEQSETLGALAKALAAAQRVMHGAKKDSVNPAFKSSYADLESVWGACREPLAANGLAVVQTTEPQGLDGVTVVTTLIHESGEWIRGRYFCPAVKKDAHGFGSATTYARRFALSAMVGIHQSDDDGNEAVKPVAAAPLAKTGGKDPSAEVDKFVAKLSEAQSSDDMMALANRLKKAMADNTISKERYEFCRQRWQARMHTMHPAGGESS